VAAVAGVQHACHNVHELPDPGAGICLQGPCGALQPSLAFVELTRPHHRVGQRYRGGRDDGFRAPAVPVSERYRLLAAPPGGVERMDLRREPELRKASDFKVGSADFLARTVPPSTETVP